MRPLACFIPRQTLSRDAAALARSVLLRHSSSAAAATQPHYDLPSFLAYAQRTQLSPTSTTYIGTRYEYCCQAALAHLGFRLTRTGGRADAGVDLCGTWHVPSHAHPLRVIVQCKALAAKAGPNLVRELEGAFAGAPAGWEREEVIGVLCARKEATKGVRDAVRRSSRGLIWVLIEDGAAEERELERGGAIRQVVWNQRVADWGAEGLGVGIVYGDSKDGTDEVHKEVRLTWEGQIWPPDSHKQSLQII